MSDHFMPEAVQAAAELAAALDPRAGETVCIATPHLDHPGWNYTESLVRVFAYDKGHGDYLLHNSGPLNNGSFCPIWGRSTELSHTRNTGAAAFLSSEADWLLWWDSDIGVQEDAVQRLMAVADPDTMPIVGGLAFVEGSYGHDFHGGLRSALMPTLYDWSWVEPKNGMPGAYKLVGRHDWQPESLTRVAATGTGFLLTHRSVYEKISHWLVDQGAPPNIWFERIPGPDGELCGEDISFCMRAHQVELPVYVDTSVTTTHQKTIWYGGAEYKQKPFTPVAGAKQMPPEHWPKLLINPNVVQEAADTSPMRMRQVYEADEEVAVIVPVAKRDNAQRFLHSLAESLSDDQRRRRQVRVYVMGDEVDGDTVFAWEMQGLLYPNLVFDLHSYAEPMGTFAEKVNRGYEISSEPWLFLVGDDVSFQRGWLDQAMETARATGKAVIGTNDLGNSAVMSGEHATHMFISRAYVDRVGASWDGPGVVCHDGYRHWFVDNEIVLAAKQTDEWAPCLLSVVEHLHPLWGKGHNDEVYRVGQDAAEADRERWFARVSLFGSAAVIKGADGSVLRVARNGDILSNVRPAKIENEGE